MSNPNEDTEDGAFDLFAEDEDPAQRMQVLALPQPAQSSNAPMIQIQPERVMDLQQMMMQALEILRVPPNMNLNPGSEIINLDKLKNTLKSPHEKFQVSP